MKLIIGQYVPGRSIIHKIDPRAKLIAVFLLVVVVFLANNWPAYGLVILFTAIGLISAKIPFRFIYRGLKPVLFIIIFTFVLNVLFTHRGETLFQWGFIQLTTEGLKQALFISVRLLTIIIATTLLTLTTTPIEITDALEVLLGPLKKLRFPVHEFALMMSIALRFIPTLTEETEKIMKAQSARGVDFSSGSLARRAKAIVPLLVPLFVSAFKRADELAMAMEARGYRGDVGRTKWRLLEWRLRDTLLLLSIILLTVALVFLRS
ncbi:energy-coupling factor transporter transmembrane component T family protein [Camelliibacillus cellulosilyticus]|uniref:Energy-coupling factor transporter transmembrane protein EcfT n=1 Tax=Camelliibacillus cellulosilyticus TaxID=2174486 RepID=A0ABV9GRU5_9BACL